MYTCNIEIDIGGNNLAKGTQKINNPLAIIGIFSTISELAMAATLLKLSSELQEIFIWFVMLFPTLLVILFFMVIFKKPTALYAPSDFKDEDNYIKTVTNIKLESKLEDDKDVILQVVTGKTFKDETVETKNKKFLNCTFDHCEIVFSGEGSLIFSSCSFLNCAWTLIGSAMQTIKFLSNMYTLGESGKSTIEETFQLIREGNYLS